MGKDRSRMLAKLDKNLPAKKYKKGTPAQIRLEFAFEGGTTQYIDIAKALSQVNRKFYRQGCYYYINSVEMYDNADSVVNLHVCPDNWVTRAAYRKGKALYDEMTMRAMETVTGDILPVYHDFKVYISELHRTTGSKNVRLNGLNDTGLDLVSDDWEYSQFVTADYSAGAPADEFTAHMLGPTTTSGGQIDSVGLIESYQKTRATVPLLGAPNVGNVDPTDPLLNLFDYSSEEVQNDVIDNVSTKGELPPYETSIYPGSYADNHQRVARLVTSAEVGRVVQEEGFCAPLGLVVVDPLPMSSENNFTIVLNLAPGTYHGVYAERMA